jgi:agmatinase
VGPVDARQIPRYAGLGTFARLPQSSEVKNADIAILGVPFDAGTTYRPGARFGPQAIRQASRLLRPYDPALDTEPWSTRQVVDSGDVGANPFSIPDALAAIERDIARLLAAGPGS